MTQFSTNMDYEPVYVLLLIQISALIEKVLSLTIRKDPIIFKNNQSQTNLNIHKAQTRTVNQLTFVFQRFLEIRFLKGNDIAPTKNKTMHFKNFLTRKELLIIPAQTQILSPLTLPILCLIQIRIVIEKAISLTLKEDQMNSKNYKAWTNLIIQNAQTRIVGQLTFVFR